MIVHTDTEALRQLRRTILELILSNHPRHCLTCQQSGTGVLRDLAYEYGLPDDLPYVPHERPSLEESVGNVVIYRDPAKCILCGKCLRTVIREEPLAIYLNGEWLVTLMRTPGSERELGLAFF